MTDYKTKRVQTPPTIKEIDGQWFVQIHDGDLTLEAPIGEWFAAQFVTRVIIPKLVLDAMKNA